MTESTPFLITLDGPAGVGKSSLAKYIANYLSIAFLDTGAMFRAIALKLASVYPDFFDQPIKKIDLTKTLPLLVFSLKGVGNNSALYCNGSLIGEEVRSEVSGMMAAKIATIPEVRLLLKQAQQDIGKTSSLVAEGRDMGTEVFPSAQIKIFLDATVEERAKRRLQQLQGKDQSADLDTILMQISERDYQDKTRSVSPLKPAPDAILIDTTNKSLEEVQTVLINIIKDNPSYSCGKIH